MLEPVTVSGSRVSRATLHNEDEIKRKDIRVGDTVVIEKAGEVIPAVVEVVKSKRPRSAKPFDFLKHIHGKCPVCGGAVRRDPQFVAWRCENHQCPAQTTRRVEFLAARGALDIETVGGIVADKLVERGLVREPLDLFELKMQDLATLNLSSDESPRVFGEKNATKAITAIRRAKTLPLSRWLFALAIPDVGKTTATQLARFHQTIADVANSQLLRDILDYHQNRDRKQDTREIAERLIKAGFAKPSKSKGEKKRGIVTEVGPVVAESVLDFFAARGREESSPAFEGAPNSAEERKGLGEKSRRLAADGKDVCPYRNSSLDDAGRGDRENRGARRPRKRQRKQKNRFRSRRIRTRQQN